MTPIDWQERAWLFKVQGSMRRGKTPGRLGELVNVALMIDDLSDLAIQTNSGKMFCRYEIGYIAMLADRPRGRMIR